MLITTSGVLRPFDRSFGINNLTHRPGWLVGWLVDWLVWFVLVGWLVGWFVWLFCWWVGLFVGGFVGWLVVCWCVGWFIGWVFDWFVLVGLVDWFVCWLVGWLIGWLVLTRRRTRRTRRHRRKSKDLWFLSQLLRSHPKSRTWSTSAHYRQTRSWRSPSRIYLTLSLLWATRKPLMLVARNIAPKTSSMDLFLRPYSRDAATFLRHRSAVSPTYRSPMKLFQTIFKNGHVTPLRKSPGSIETTWPTTVR